ncbi:hypothetical protein ID866_11636 [Astraeus odoratus]|nr:hypothetical protein ID866_11636 [Astraeus odoratus]
MESFGNNADRFVREAHHTIVHGIPSERDQQTICSYASRSGEFYIEKENIDVDMAFASFHIMWQDLRFNICNLETSYLPNSDIVDLDQRIRDNISHHLSYSCRFWGIHLHEAEFEGALAMQVKAFFTCPRVLYWLEVLNLIKALENAVPVLKAGVNWLMGHDQGVPTTALDAIKFVQTFGTIILHSTPHFYLSALPFTPTTCALHKLISPSFLHISQVACEHALDWPTTQLLLKGKKDHISSIAFYEDGKKIVSTSYRSTNLWDVETVVKIDSHVSTTRVSSVAYSPDGTRITVGSDTNGSICLLDVKSRMEMRCHRDPHTEAVISVAFTLDGAHISSCSEDGKILPWNTEPLYFKVVTVIETQGKIFQAVFSADHSRIATRAHPSIICVWSTHTGKPVGNL